MKTPSSVRVKMRKNEISEESKKKSVKLTPIKKNSKESKQFLKPDYEEDELDDFSYKTKKSMSTLDYFDDEDDFDDDDDNFYDEDLDSDYAYDEDDEDYDDEESDDDDEEEDNI